MSVSLRRLAAAVVAVLGATALLVPATLRPAKAGDDALAFTPSGIDGGGMTNVLAADPFHSGVLLAGQDTSGIWRSSDAGDHWSPVDLPSSPADPLFSQPAAMRVQALQFDPKNENFVYAALGNVGTKGLGSGGGFATSTDGGQHWRLASVTPHFQVASGPAYFSDPTGHLIAVDPESGQLYVATYDQGIMRSDDGGATWKTIALAGRHLRAVVIDPDNPTVVLGTVLSGGSADQPVGGKIWRVTGANGASPQVSELSTSPSVAEDLQFSGDRLYAAAGYDGVYASSDDGTTWSQVFTPEAPNSNMSWDCLAGTGDTVFAGSARARSQWTDVAQRPSIIRSTDGGQTWKSITADSTRIHFTVHGTDTTWWHDDPLDAPGGNRYAASFLVLDPFDPNRLLSGGKSGVWRTDEADDADPDWYPAINGLNVTFNWGVQVDPAKPERVYVGDTDWSFFGSSDGLRTVTQSRPFQEQDVSENVFDIALDPADTTADGVSRVYVSTEAVGDAPGDIYTAADPVADPGGWTGLGLGDAVANSCGGHRNSIGVSVNHRPDSAAPIVLAAVDGCGVWRKEGGAAWQRVLGPDSALGSQISNRAAFAWPAGSATAYLYDHNTGVWQSDDYGRTWSMLWAHPLNETGAFDTTGYLAAPADHPGCVFVSTTDGLYEISGGNDPVAVPGISAPGPIAYRDGSLYVAGRSTAGQPLPTLSRAALAADGTVGEWTDIADDTYRAMAQFPHGIAVGADGSVYVAVRGNGTVVGRPVDAQG
ncbi:MAG TPA: hypothetical protein VHC49_11920 [Mycobacteriales bacterium]|nr:hypothetical protein [Mycobacteriales bacterium]